MKLSMITRTVTGTISGYTVTKETTMKQIDTAQLDITACQAQAAEYHARGFNCAQAVACTLAPAVGLDPQVAFTLTEGFGAGMGLPNMVKCSDKFDIQSKVGEGTCITMQFKHQSEDCLLYTSPSPRDA